MNETIKNMFTGKDNLTVDFIRVLAIVAVLVALGLEIYVVCWKATPFDLQAFGIGMGVMFATAGAALKIKETTEPAVGTTESITSSGMGPTVSTTLTEGPTA